MERIGLLPNYIVKKKNLYCNIEIVLQAIGEKVVGLYCKMGDFGLELYCNTVIVLQRRKLGGLKLYCKRVKCIAIEAAWLLKKLYCNTVWWAAGLYYNKNLYCEEAWPVSRYSGLGNWARARGAQTRGGGARGA